MLSLVRWTLMPAVVLGWVLVSGPARAAGPVIKDEAHFFKPETVRQAETVLREIYNKYDQEVVIETLATPPGGETKAKELADMTPPEREKFFSNWLKERAREERVSGVYVLICKHPGHVEVGTGPNTAEKAFTPSNRNELRKILRDHLARKEADQGLLDAVRYVRDTMSKNLRSHAESRPSHNAPLPGPVHTPRGANPLLGGLGGLICIGLVGVLVIWVIVALIRAFTGGGGRYAGGPGGGYMGGGGYGGGGYGGGGGGFMSGLLGGLFGAAAGSWMYDRFLRDGGQSSSGTSAAGGDTGAGAGTDYPAPDQGRDFETSGGDFDSGNAGGDYSDSADAGGDFGGGDTGSGDFGGGGAWGGGGDVGGGGGGDF